MIRLIAATGLLAALATAWGKAKGHEGKSRHAAQRVEGHPAFRDVEVRILIEYSQPSTGRLPPGLARKSEFPPGIMKQLARGKRLPPGLQPMIEPFPPDLDRRLPPLPAGYRRVLCGTRALLVQDEANLVIDIVDLIGK